MVKIAVCGCGAVGSQIAWHIAHPEHEFFLIDDDRIAPHNVETGTSIYSRHHVGMLKVDALSELLWRRCGCRCLPHGRTLVSPATITRWEPDLVIDGFDNSEARALTHGLGIATVHVGVSDARTGEVTWDERYQVPPAMFERNNENAPCFPAGTMVLTTSGYRTIETIEAGDHVLTHRQRWMPVTKTMSSTGDTIVVKGHGHLGLELTGEHPVYARERGKRVRRGSVRLYEHGDAQWVDARHLLRRRFMWATPCKIPSLSIPVVGGRGLEFSETFWWLVGVWLADGIVLYTDGKPAKIRIYCSFGKANDLEKRLEPISEKAYGKNPSKLHFTRSNTSHKTASTFVAYHQGLAEWLVDNFGTGASRKKIPGWVYGLPLGSRKALLDGYIYGDGYTEKGGKSSPRVTCQTVSRALAFGIRTLAATLGHAVGVYDRTPSRDTIEGRKVNILPAIGMAWTPNPGNRWVFDDGSLKWSRVESITGGHNDVPVFNLSVLKDESYVAEGIIVHNCTHALGRQILRFTSAVAAGVIERFIATGVRVDLVVTEGMAVLR